MDFVIPATRVSHNTLEVYPKFIVKHSEDLMIRGSDFYAVWIEEDKRWSTDEQDVINLVDNMLRKAAKEKGTDNVAYMWDADSHSIDKWHQYCSKQMRDNWTLLDSKLVFQDEEVKKEDFVTKRLPYVIKEGDISSYQELANTLYSKDELHKIEWMIGSILTGDSKNLQKFYVFYGAPGTGKSTMLNIVQELFPGYSSAFDAKSLGDKNNTFSLEQFKHNPLIAIDHDSNLSRIDENNRLNSLISHETVTVNEKHKSMYQARFQTVLIIATNKPVLITDSKSGLLRRLIDINPTGRTLSQSKYFKLMSDIKFELGAIAKHCIDVYTENKHLYDSYEAREMIALSNDFYDFMIEQYDTYLKDNKVTLAKAYQDYLNYCTSSNVNPMKKKDFKAELKSYFSEFYERRGQEWCVYEGFLANKFGNSLDTIMEESKPLEKSWLNFDKEDSLFDKIYKDCPAQLTNDDGTPRKAWDNVTTKLEDIDTHQLHFMRPPENHIVIDFDLKGPDGEKSLSANIKAASDFPPTYAELSKSGSGIHLHYNYSGDASMLSRYYANDVEIKVFTGKSSLRRRLTKCNDIGIKDISFNLPVKGDKKMIEESHIESVDHLKCLIKKCLAKEYGSTTCCVDFIKKLLDDAYNSDLLYDVTPMKPAIYSFCANSTHQALKCLNTFKQMHFMSKVYEEGQIPEKDINTQIDTRPIVFFDCEIFPNLFLIAWKERGKEEKHVMINPNPKEVKGLVDSSRLIGFNNLKYDNHMLYARMLGYSESDLFSLSNRLINEKSKNCTFQAANTLAYTDIYDFSSAANKKSLKKWEIELGIHHHELGYKWDQPVPADKWKEVADYCKDDITATEAVFNHLQADWTARQILADIAELPVCCTTNQLTTRIIFGMERNPQPQFNYRDMGDVSQIDRTGTIGDPEWTKFDAKGRPIFPGYTYDHGTSTYRDVVTGEGGYVFATPGIYRNVPVLDIASMHPSSIEDEELFGPVFTKRFSDIKKARILIKHKDWDSMSDILDGKLTKYLTTKDDPSAMKSLSNALKTAINSVYGLTSASFPNPFRDPRNIDNIVAKRGALFMVNLKNEVEARGFTVVHIKTDSIKIADATPDIIQFVMDYGKMYGYVFEHESTYDRICLVNDAVYIAKYSDDTNINGENAGKWTATGAEFQHPYIFKKLFSGEEIELKDMGETRQVNGTAIYLDMNEGHEDEHNRHFVGRIGCFLPVTHGGGIMVKEMKDKEGNPKYDSVTRSQRKDKTPYRWLELETVREQHLENDIDMSYYNELCNSAIDHIEKFGDFEGFRS